MSSLSFRLRIHPRARRIRLKVLRDASLEVVAPPGARRRTIRDFVEANRGWVEQTRMRINAGRRDGPQTGPFPAELDLRSLGQVASVRYSSSRRPHFRWDAQHLVIGLPDRHAQAVRTLLLAALKQRAQALLMPRFESLAVGHGLIHGRVSWRNQTSRWGSCSASGNISLNVRLMFLPSELVDYVFVHELAHLQHHDHSARFWGEVERMLPGAMQLRRDIRQADRWLPDWILRDGR